ncbi:unnamed protein product [Gulo gulo]|uniref:Uncharacterized protein n=1 Tax=Gulo gulo TaxID=48420 RepID=A0A9X9M7R7_GULGU|nr:unnamed protein product [Gulo gulo]
MRECEDMGCLRVLMPVQTKKEEPLPPATSRNIPTFYFPRGRPKDMVNIDAVITKIERTFAQFPHERATMEDMGRVAKACGCPLYWKGPLFCSAGGERTGAVSVHKFVAMWRKVLQNCHDDAAKFVHLLMNPGANYLVQEDFIPFLQDVVNTHPGLAFLKEASEFHSRYITTGHLGGPTHRTPSCRDTRGSCVGLVLAECGALGRGSRHQSADRVLLLRALLRHLLQVLGAGHGPRPSHRFPGPGPAQRPRHIHQDDREDILGGRDEGQKSPERRKNKLR